MSYLVCIDAGHGKSTAGKRSPDQSLLEWEFNRDVAKRIEKHLSRCGVSTLLTAPGETDVSLARRVNLANEAKATIFVSIHANAYLTDWNDANGWEIYYCKGSFNGASLAQAIHSESIPYLGVRDRGMKTTTEYTVVLLTRMPAVLIEHGFYTNKAEVELLKSDEYREKCAIADAKGILKYLNVPWKAEHWAQKYFDSLVMKGLIDNPSMHQDLDQTLTKGEVFQILDKMTDPTP